MSGFSTFISVFLVQAMMMKSYVVKADSNLKWKSGSNGYIPDYSVVGGEDYPGEALYVARITSSHGGHWATPGKVDASAKVAHYTYGGREYYKRTYEVLTNPDWKSHLQWVKFDGSNLPQNAVKGGRDYGRDMYVARCLYFDGHMIPGKADFDRKMAWIGYGGKEYVCSDWWVLVERAGRKKKRDMLSAREYPNLPFVKALKSRRIFPAFK